MTNDEIIKEVKSLERLKRQTPFKVVTLLTFLTRDCRYSLFKLRH